MSDHLQDRKQVFRAVNTTPHVLAILVELRKVIYYVTFIGLIIRVLLEIVLLFDSFPTSINKMNGYRRMKWNCRSDRMNAHVFNGKNPGKRQSVLTGWTRLRSKQSWGTY